MKFTKKLDKQGEDIIQAAMKEHLRRKKESGQILTMADIEELAKNAPEED